MIRARLSGMKTRIVRIGNSQGIHIPKSFLQRSKLTEEVELDAFDNYLVIRSTAKEPREGWDEAFRLAADDDGVDLSHRSAQ